MNDTEPAVDPVRAFTEALTPDARRHLDGLTYDAIRWINAACTRLEPAELAAICSHQIRRNTYGARQLVLFRLRRESGLDNDQEEGA